MDVVDQYILLLKWFHVAEVPVAVYNVNHKASVKNVRNRVVEAKRRVVAGVGVILLKICKQLYLNNKKFTSSLRREFTITTKIDMASA